MSEGSTVDDSSAKGSALMLSSKKEREMLLACIDVNQAAYQKKA